MFGSSAISQTGTNIGEVANQNTAARPGFIFGLRLGRSEKNKHRGHSSREELEGFAWVACQHRLFAGCEWSGSGYISLSFFLLLILFTLSSLAWDRAG